MAIATRSMGLTEDLTTQGSGGGAPVLIFELDAEAIGTGARSGVRSLGSIRVGDTSSRRRLSPDEEVTAVLVLRSLTSSRLLASIRALTRAGAGAGPGAQLAAEAGARHVEDRVNRRLTPREHDVLRLLADGHTTAGIAEELCYSERTVKKVVHDLLAKLNCRTRAQAVALAVRQGVI